MNSRAMARSKAGRSETRAQTSPTNIATAPRATCPSASPAAPIPEIVAAAPAAKPMSEDVRSIREAAW